MIMFQQRLEVVHFIILQLFKLCNPTVRENSLIFRKDG